MVELNEKAKESLIKAIENLEVCIDNFPKGMLSNRVQHSYRLLYAVKNELRLEFKEKKEPKKKTKKKTKKKSKKKSKKDKK